MRSGEPVRCELPLQKLMLLNWGWVHVIGIPSPPAPVLCLERATWHAVVEL